MCATRDDKARPLWTSEGEGVRVKQEGELDGEYAGEQGVRALGNTASGRSKLRSTTGRESR